MQLFDDVQVFQGPFQIACYHCQGHPEVTDGGFD